MHEASGRTKTVMETLHPLGFLDSRRAHDAELLIGKADELVTMLGPTELHLQPAHEALSAAKALFAAAAYSQARLQARRAASLATSLNERFTAYMAAWKVIQDCRRELELIGYPTASLDAALAAADAETVHRVEEDGTLVPNYVGATVLLEDAAVEARRLVAHARETSHDIFLATLAVEVLSDSPTRRVPSWLAVRLEGMIERATRELACGHETEARRIALEARSRADGARAGAARAWEMLDLAAAMLDGLGADGTRADELSNKLGSTRAALAQGFLDRATAIELAERLSDEVSAFAREYPRARRWFEGPGLIYAGLRRTGLRSDEVEDALARAADALARGDWGAVGERAGDASLVILRVRTEQEELARAISELRTRANLLVDFRLPMLPGVLELLSRAENEARAWLLPAAREDLDLANALMLQATRTGS